MGRSLIGIEITSSEICMVQKKGTGYNIAVEKLPENIMRGDHIVSFETLSMILKDMKAENRFSGKDVAIVLPEYALYFRTATVPVQSDSQLKMSIPYEFRDYVGARGNDFYYDYSVDAINYDADEKPQSVEILCCAAQKEVVKDYERVLHRAGLTLKVALPREMAMVYLMRESIKENEDIKDICFVEIGYDHSRVFIFRGDNIMATKTIDYGCISIDSVIAGANGIDPYLAQSWRETNHNNVLEDPYCVSVYDEIALEVMKTINFYTYENSGVEISKAYFFGIGAEIEPLTKDIATYCDFDNRSLVEILPSSIGFDEMIDHAITAIGITL